MKKKELRRIAVFFNATKYIPGNECIDIYEKCIKEIPFELDRTYLVQDDELDEVLKEDKDAVCIVFPMSGSVQSSVVTTALHFRTSIFFPAYMKGGFSDELSERLLKANSAPAIMDSYAVAKRSSDHIEMISSFDRIDTRIRILKAEDYIRNAKLLLIGNIEPWVVSNNRDLSVYENKLGCTIERMPYDELIASFEKTTDEEAREIYSNFMDKVGELKSVNEDDVRRASRFAFALNKLLDDKNADGCALACFNLIPLVGTTSCLALSYINQKCQKLASCEGDVESLLTMLIARKLTAYPLWMANPNLQRDGSVNFVHCTAPIRINGDMKYNLMKHHETGKGVSPEVMMPEGIEVSMLRIGNNAESFTAMKARSIEAIHENSCRSQMHLMPENPEGYLRTSLGCHQVMAFEDITEMFRTVCRDLDMKEVL